MSSSIYNYIYVGIKAETLYNHLEQFTETIPAEKNILYDKDGNIVKEEIITEERKYYRLDSFFEDVEEDEYGLEEILYEKLDIEFFDEEINDKQFFGLLVGNIDCYEQPFLTILNIDFINNKKLELQSKLKKLNLDINTNEIKVFTYMHHSC